MKRDRTPEELALIMMFKKRLIETMNKKEMNAEYLAKLSGVSKGMISMYLSKEKIIEPGQLNGYKLAVALRVDPSWLMGLNGDACAEILKKDELCDAVSQLSDEGRQRVVEYASDLMHVKKYRKAQ